MSYEIKVKDLTDTSSIAVDDEIIVLTDDTNNIVKNITVENLLTNIISSDEDNGITVGSDSKLYVDDADSGVTAGTYQYPQNLVVDSKGKITSVTAGSAANIEPATTTTLGGVIVGGGLSVEEDGTLSAIGRNIGEFVTSIIPLTDAGLHLLDGTLLSGSGIYADFVDYIADLYNSDTYTIYAYVYNDGTDDYTIYADDNTTPTTLYNYDGTAYTGSDFTVSSGVVYYSSNACTYTSSANVEITNLAYFTDETTWQSAVTTYGVCGKFVYDSVDNTVRLPKITGFIEGTTDTTALGDLIEAGLPNITGSFSIAEGAYLTNSPNGCFSSFSGTAYEDPGTGGNGASTANFDASASNSIYDNSSTVQPQSIKVLYYIVAATSTKTDIEVDIDEIATDLNGKADVDLSNINSTGQNLVTSLGIPDYDNSSISSFALNTVYQAPTNGVVVCPMYTGSSNGHLLFNTSQDNVTWTYWEAFGAATSLVYTWYVYLPKNYYFKFTVSTSAGTIYTYGLRGFFPLKGAN